MKKLILLVSTVIITTSSFAQTDSIGKGGYSTDTIRANERLDKVHDQDVNKFMGDEMLNNKMPNKQNQIDQHINENGAPIPSNPDSLSTQKTGHDDWTGKKTGSCKIEKTSK